jgi:flagellar hook-associated protein 1 FlgK
MAVATGFPIAESGLRAAQTGLYVTGHNIANSDMEGYTRQRSIQCDFSPQTLERRPKMTLQKGLGADIAHIRQIRDAFIDAVYRKETGKTEFYNVLVQAGRDIEDTTGELQSAYKAQSVLNDMWDALNELSIFQPGLEARANFISTAVTFVDKANNAAERFIATQRVIDEQIRESVDKINDITQIISKYNFLIMDAEAAGENANDFRDVRNNALDELSEYADISYRENIDGKIDVFCEGNELIVNGNINYAGLKYSSEGYDFVEPVLIGAPTKDILPFNAPTSLYKSMFHMNDPVDAAHGNDKGRLKGLLAARGFAPANYATTPQKPLAPSLMFTFVNAPPDSGAYTWIDANDRARYDAFRAAWDSFLSAFTKHAADPEKYAAQKPPELPNFSSALPAGFAADFDVFTNGDYTGYVSEYAVYSPLYDDWAVEYKAYENTLFDVNYALIPRAQKQFDTICHAVMTLINDALAPYDGVGQKSADAPYGLDNSRYNEVFIRKHPPYSSRFDGSGAYVSEDPANSVSLYSIGNVLVNPELLNTAGYGKIPLSLSGDVDDTRLVLGLMDKWKGELVYSALSVDDAYRQFITGFASDTDEAQTFSDEQNVLLTQIANKRRELSGVSLDEEITKMLKYQHAYIASARVITIIDSMIEKIIGGFRG